ncbi:hypothetical protein [Lelliottia amnigena]|uniref:hypothetical protein n=1 Tax=Lelliottia amnigena TaxID=61646 RepID=UPI004056F627
MKTNTVTPIYVIAGPDVEHYGNREPRRKKRRGGLACLSWKAIIVGTLVGFVETTFHAAILACYTKMLMAWGATAAAAAGFAPILILLSVGIITALICNLE